MRNIVFTLSMLSLAGCSQIQGLRTNISAFPPEAGDNVEERALQSELRSAYQNCGTAARPLPASDGPRSKVSYLLPSDKDAKLSKCVHFDSNVREVRVGERTTYKDGKLTTLDSSDPIISDAKRMAVERIISFTNAGMTLSDLYCDRFFREANLSSRKRRFTRGLSNDVGGAIATALGLARVASGVVGGVAGGFAFADSSFRNYDESFMVDADLSKMRRMVLSAQDNMKLGIRKDPPETIFGAESKVIRYAGLCSFLGMKDLLNESVAEKTAIIELKNKKISDGGDPPTLQQPHPEDPAIDRSVAPAAGVKKGSGVNTTIVAPNAGATSPADVAGDAVITSPAPVAPQAPPG